MITKTSISIDAGILERARAVARQNRRSLSAQVEFWLEDALDDDPGDSGGRAYGSKAARKGNGKGVKPAPGNRDEEA